MSLFWICPIIFLSVVLPLICPTRSSQPVGQSLFVDMSYGSAKLKNGVVLLTFVLLGKSYAVPRKSPLDRVATLSYQNLSY